MDDPGYASYQDPRLQPPDEGDPTPAECLERCLHKEACIMQVSKLQDWPNDQYATCWGDEEANNLGCSIDCECWAEV